MKLNVSHQTHYTYAQQVKHSTQYLRLTPQNSSHQKILSWDLTLPEYATCTLDAYGNVLHVLTLDQPHQAITIEANGVVEIEDNTEDDSCGASLAAGVPAYQPADAGRRRDPRFCASLLPATGTARKPVQPDG